MYKKRLECKAIFDFGYPQFSISQKLSKKPIIFHRKYIEH